MHDAPMGPKTSRSTVLTLEAEALMVIFRKHTLRALDDRLYALQPTIPQLPRSALPRGVQRHDIGHLPKVGGVSLRRSS